MGHTVGMTTIVHKDDFAYLAHPSITVLDDGEWLAGFGHTVRSEPRRHPPNDPLFRTLLTRSSDQGKSWEQPWFAPDFDWSGVEPPGLTRLRDGTVVFTQFRFGWYPIELAKRRRAEGEPISIDLEGRGWTEDFTDDEWAGAKDPWARGYDGLYAHLSSDGGRLFDRSARIDTTPYRQGFTRAGPVELSDGRLAYAVTEHHPPTSRHTYIVFSESGGATWSAPTLIAESPELRFNEPHIAEVGPDEIFCILRHSKENIFLHACRSEDGGRTWSVPEATPLVGLPGHLLVLSDGRLLCTYGLRSEPFSIRASLSEDGGRTWLTDQEIVVRGDLPNGDLGYPTTIEYAPGRLFVCYYGQEPDGVTCVQGTYVDLE